MHKHLMIPAAIALAVVGCTTTSDSNKAPKPAWSAVYTVPFDAMVACLSQPAGEGFVVNLESTSPQGTATILFVPRSAPQAESNYNVFRRADGTIQVNWQRLGTVGGLDWLDVQARQRANRCGGVG